MQTGERKAPQKTDNHVSNSTILVGKTWTETNGLSLYGHILHLHVIGTFGRFVS